MPFHLPLRSPRPRQAAACLLALLAAGLALWPTPVPATAVVAAHDLPPGVALTAADLRVAPLTDRPSGVLESADAVVGQALTGAARAGEPITDVRLTPPDPDATSVAVRLADAGVAELLRTGDRVDVIGPDAELLAENAAVLAVHQAKPDRLVVLGLSRKNATRTAAVSLDHPLAVTLR
ncbi:SAF domain-containing protein [Umezawaea sp. Da 62-37]|uniref:SAF domain-containing protein n=1 Tax=Umezawaea sp. Da 62-37 TaxID=3075927 RepID=UPI0028F6D580|nr:SAF domain-containing protein [Umezawaea sp. Da 62-37]WNV82194.1 SAF domain-containing protein [Umezawaea sp. Da 62-37]